MQIPSISNTQPKNQTFQGNINIVNDLSYLPCKYVRKAYDSMAKMIEDKPFDLFIKQDHKNKTLNFIAKKPEDLGKIKKPFVKNIILDAPNLDNGQYTEDLYKTVAKETIDTYNTMYPTYTKGEKIKRFFNKLANEIVEAFQDKDEI